MAVNSAIIKVTNLRLRTFIGFNPEEMAKMQDVVINVAIKHSINAGIYDDIIEDALNYKVITKRIIQHVESGKFLLLEKLAADILDICIAHPSVLESEVTVDKPNALRFADSVSITLEYNTNNHLRHNMLEEAS